MKLGKNTLRKFKLTGWTFELRQTDRTVGECNYDDKLISVNKEFTKFAKFNEFKDTLLHEIAHVLAGFRAGHGKKWKLIMKQLGCRNINASYKRVYFKEVGDLEVKCKYCGDKIIIPTYLVKQFRESTLYCGKCCKKHNGDRVSKRYKFIEVVCNDS